MYEEIEYKQFAIYWPKVHSFLDVGNHVALVINIGGGLDVDCGTTL